ncbi:MAG: polysaccharide deacetylase family protein [Spirochaetaceae bacterium]|jgi:peptidoglycan/xylan/chitin deacetylase (PgdA/CDA1 family)|nr:polysaccharide deacetylase family protein [Spirochaetaceae bacterium]
MKIEASLEKFIFRCSCCLLASMVFLSCMEARTAVRRDPPERVEEAIRPPAIDRAVERVKANGAEIGKYFVTGENDQIAVKADIREGDAEFEVQYDIEEWDDSETPPAGESLLVRFSVEDKRTGERQAASFRWRIPEDAAGILLAFDDDYRQTWEEYFDILDDYGARATYFVQGELSDFCFRALSRGHDIGYHTINHLNLPKVSAGEFYYETTSDIDSFRRAGVPIKAFAYPFGLSEPWMREALTSAFAIQRGFGVTFRVYSAEDIRKGYIASRSIDNILFQEEESFEAVITGMFRTLKFLGGERVLPITTHDISDTAQWGIKPRRLEYLLRAARFFKLKFYRYSDFFPDPPGTGPAE